MYFRLTHVDGAALPAECRIGSRSYMLSAGGALLEPPRPPFVNGPDRGYSVLRLQATDAPQPNGLVGASSEPYHWTSPRTLQIGRTQGGPECRFSGSLANQTLELVAEGGGVFIPTGTRLRFVAAPDVPITDGWRKVFYHGPPHVEYEPPADAAARQAVEQHVREFIQEQDRAALLAAGRRIEDAWRAPA